MLGHSSSQLSLHFELEISWYNLLFSDNITAFSDLYYKDNGTRLGGQEVSLSHMVTNKVKRRKTRRCLFSLRYELNCSVMCTVCDDVIRQAVHPFIKG